jgi:quinohemoprotein amine dehydrogenase
MVRGALLFALCAAVAVPAAAQTAAPAGAPTNTAPAPEGIPVTSELVVAKCGTCHMPDAEKRLTRISSRRSTPENWERTIKRMIQLNKAPITAEDARAIIKYLSDNHGLAPEEAKAVAFEVEHRGEPHDYTADRETAIVCSSCHSIGRPMSDRRTKAEWEGVIAMHRGYYPGVDNQPMNDGQGFRRTRAVEPGGDKRHPMERVIEHLAKAYPLTSSAWSDWSAARQAPMLAGRWALSGDVPGKGRIFGTMTVTADPKTPDTFITETKYTFAKSGEIASRKGRSVVYTGFQWRGRSALAMPDAPAWREVMFVERNQKEMSGRWFGGDYDELGMEVKLVRIGAEPLVSGASLPSLKTASSAPALKIFGANFPAKLLPAQISLGQGITVTRIVSSTPDAVTLAVQVAPDAVPGPRDLLAAGAHAPAALVVYDKVDTIRVLPQAGLARVGGAVFPKQFQQFEAVAFHNGPDKAPNTADDWNLGLVDAAWTMEEYAATFDDTDVKYVGAIDAAGLFTPNVDGPNPERKLSEADLAGRNNIGDVWIVATVNPDTARGIAAPIRARSQLVVSVPLYINWTSSSVGQ